MSQRILIAVALALGALVAGLALFWNPGSPAASSGPAGGDFSLLSADGPVSLKDYRGKVVLLSFGYTYCPDICPTALAGTAAALKLLTPDEAKRTAAIFVSVDPERDTPTHLKEYVAFFHPSLVGVTGAPGEVARVAKQYGVYYAKHQSASAAGYSVDHTAETHLIGSDGTFLGRIPFGSTPEQVAMEVRKRLNSK